VLVLLTPCWTPWGPPCIQDLLVLDTPLGRVLTETGEVYACGSGNSGRLGTGNNKDRLTPVKITLRLSIE
jgi:alpha-tubulin suppressor-like RCC1 family protein